MTRYRGSIGPLVVGVVEHRDELPLLDNTDDADQSLTQLAIAAVSGSLPAGPEIHQRPPVSLRGEPEVALSNRQRARPIQAPSNLVTDWVEC